MELITCHKRLDQVFKEEIQSCASMAFAVAWASTGFQAYELLTQNRAKIRRSVIGTHFYQTDVEVIRQFSNSKYVRFVTDHSEIFHPKIYMFCYPQGRRTYVIGSANLTAGGFTRNQEACLVIHDTDPGVAEVAARVQQLIEEHWLTATPGSEIDCARYSGLQKVVKRHLAHAAGEFGNQVGGHRLEDVEILQKGWGEFLSDVALEQDHTLDRRLEVLGAAKQLFQQYGSFEDMPLFDRQGIAGFREDDTLPWGWFGSMRGAGVFKNLVNEAPSGFSSALDQIPLNGRVDRADYSNFIHEYLGSFPTRNGNPTRHGLATATRLLAMKRPDYFVCLDSANKKRLLDAFGIRLNNHDYKGYWDQIIERIMLATWWRSRRPLQIKPGRVWDGRAAMLDALYYIPR